MLNELSLLLVELARENPLGLLIGLFILVLIGSIIIWVVGALIFFIPAAIIAGVVWFLTQNTDYAGLAFLLVALLSLVKK